MSSFTGNPSGCPGSSSQNSAPEQHNRAPQQRFNRPHAANSHSPPPLNSLLRDNHGRVFKVNEVIPVYIPIGPQPKYVLGSLVAVEKITTPNEPSPAPRTPPSRNS